jgi:endoglucanase
MRKKIVFLLALICILCTLASCGKSGQSDGEDASTQNSSTSIKAAANEDESGDLQAETEESESGDTQESSTIPCPSVNGALHVSGSELLDEKNQVVQLKGVTTHGLAWFPEYVNEDAFATLHKDWNVSVIRLAMYTADSGGYCTDGDQENLKELIDNGVTYATNQDMYVIIDWHILSDGNPNQYKEEAKAFFDEMSKKYADHNNVIFEICNEPNGDTSWNDVKSYAEEIIPIIRQNDNDAVILVGTPNWSQYVDQAAADPITGYDNIMYTLHFYAATHQEDLRNTLKSALEQNLPVFVSEYSICDASGNGAIDEEQANEWMSLLDQYHISCVNWSLCNKEESASILKSECTKTSDFESSDLSPAGLWLFHMLTGDSKEE